MINLSDLNFNFALLLKEIKDRNIDLNYVENTNLVQAKLDQHVEHLLPHVNRLTPGVYCDIMQDKFYSKALVRQSGFSVVDGCVFQQDDIDAAMIFADQIGYPVVIKPVNLAQGELVFANLQTPEEFTNAFVLIAQHNQGRSILVEKHFHGADYRFLVVDNGDIAVVMRTHPTIIGDGQLTIAQLVEQENTRRMNPRTTCLCELYLDDHEAKRTLLHQGLTEQSIPQKGRVVTLRYNANVSKGAECENVLDIVHPSYLALAREIHALFPGSGYTCVDLLIKTITAPVDADLYVFCEFNVSPGLSLHHMPSKGKPHFVARSIIDLLFPETARGTIR